MINAEVISSYANRTYPSPEGAINAVMNELDSFDVKGIPTALKYSVNRYLKQIAERIASRNTSPYPGGTSGNTLSSRSGRGAASVRNSVKVEAGIDEVVGVIGGIFYLRTQEFGATIRAKRSQYLTIPLPAALDRRGVPLKRSARDWADTFIKKSKKGNLLIFQKRASGIVPLYVLKKEVRIPKRLGMEKELLGSTDLLFAYVLQEVEKEFQL